ncbi:hypothetical protein C8R48DRAFT_686355 [Suillus tomentosus]|nr:hypothetical protein C8R48DRAFT_686355 [Suillus tomentosus]
MRANFLLPCELISSAGILCFHFTCCSSSAPPSSLSFVLFYYSNEPSLHAVLCLVYLMSCLKAVSVVKLPFRTPRAPVEHFCPPDLVPRDITACPVYHDALSNITPVTLKLTNHFAPGQTYLYSSWLCHIRCWISICIWCGSTMATAITSAVLYQCVGARVQSHAWTQGQQILHTFLGHAPNSAMSVASLDILNRSQCFTVCVRAACFLCCVHIL